LLAVRTPIPLAALIDDYGDDVNIYGGWDGTPICIAYTATNPERVGLVDKLPPGYEHAA